MNPNGPSLRRDPETIARVRKLHDTGEMSSPEIARAIGISTNISHDIIADYEMDKKLEAANALQQAAREETQQRNIKRKQEQLRSMGWAGPKPESGNLVVVSKLKAIRRAHNAIGPQRRSLTASMFGDPEPHHVAMREQRAGEAVKLREGHDSNNVGNLTVRVREMRQLTKA